MAIVNDLIVNGSARFIGIMYGSLSGNAATATALTTNAGSATQPVYFSGGKPVATTYTLGKSVPSNAVFTDTVYTHPTSSGNKHIPSGGSAGQILRWSADGTAVWGADNNTTYSANTGIKLNGTTFQHTNSVTAGTAQGDANKTLTFGGTFTIPTITYDAQGHITGKGTTTMTMPANPNTWRGVQNNLTSDSTTDSLSAAQGKALKSLVDSKAASGHTHDDRYYTESEMNTKLNAKLNISLKGAASGLAELDSNGRVPSAQLPSYVDDVIEGYLYNSKFYKESSHTTEITGETGKIYVDLSNNKTYRWSGSVYAVISETLALGETSSTAYRGDRGKIAYDHSQTAHARTDATKTEASTTNGKIKINGSDVTVYTHPSGTNPHGTTKSDVGLGNVGNFKAVSTVASQGLTDTEKANARANIGAGTSSLTIGTTSSTAAAGNHTHDNRYYTESEIDTKLNGKANTSHGTHIPSTCTSITDWNSATTNGWYMGSNISNQPVANGGWFYGLTIVHNSNYVRQIAWHFATDNSVSGSNNDRYERVKQNGTWGSWVNTSVRKAVPSDAKFTDTTYGVATTSANGLMSSGDKSKLDGIAANANNYTHPTYTAKSAGFYKVTVDGTGHVSATTAVTKADITGLGIPGSDTWRGVQNNLTSTSTTDSLSAAQGKILNETKAVNKTLTNEDLNTVTTPGFYNAGGGNSVINKPSGVDHFGLIVVHNANGTYYTQNIFNDSGEWKRTCTNGTWGSWTNVTVQTAVPANAKFTDTVYTHPTTSGNKHIPSGGSAGQILRWSADGTAAWGADNNTTYGSMSVSEGTTGTATTNRVLTAANLKGIINAHAPTKTGGGASGTWGISISGNAATASKVNNKLTVGPKSYDGSAAVTIAASDLGLASAMLFLGTTTTAITDGATTNPVVIGGSNKTVTAGNVVLYGSKEFVWTGSAWEELGNEGSYKIVQAAVADPPASGTSNTFIATISQDANGKITATKKTVAVTNSAPTLAWSTTSTIGTVAGTNLQVKMPANPNTDTKVTQTVTTSNAAYPLLLAPNGQTTTTTTTSYFDSGVTLNPSTNTIAANVSGNAATATNANCLAPQGIITAISGTSRYPTGLRFGRVYTSGYPFSYGTTITIEDGSFGAELIFNGLGGNGATGTGSMYFRTHSDWSTSEWGGWATLLDSNNYNNYAPTKTGDGASGTWGISISGNAATATKLATARTIQTNLASTSAASFDGSANITPGVTGTLPIANGGTGATTASAARDNLGAQSKVLYGPSAPSDSTGSNGDMYVALESGDFKKDIVDLIYPVGSIYISMNSTDPSTLFGGTWEAFGQGRVLIGAGTGNDGSTSLSFTSGSTGGEYKHTLSVSEMPSHTHTQNAHIHTVGAHSHGLNSHTHSYTKATGVAGHTLTVAEMPSHNHTISVAVGSATSTSNNYGKITGAPYNAQFISSDYTQQNFHTTGGGGSHSHDLNTSSANTGASSGSTANSSAFNSGSTTATNQNTGGGSSHNNIMPYISVYFWKRTA